MRAGTLRLLFPNKRSNGAIVIGGNIIRSNQYHLHHPLCLSCYASVSVLSERDVNGDNNEDDSFSVRFPHAPTIIASIIMKLK